LLKGCFARAMQKAGADSLSTAFFTWAKNRGVDPTRLKMAIAMQETNLGGLSDSCAGGSCNGIGMNQVITIVTDAGESTNSSDRPEWTGITHNVLTNMKYGIRVLASKIRSNNPADIRSLARAYNGSSTAAAYAEAVVRNYSELQSKCGL
jgi:soluble lytic murein transglycosylase-like protein